MSTWTFHIIDDYLDVIHAGTVEANNAHEAKQEAREEYKEYVYSGYEPGSYKADAVMQSPFTVEVIADGVTR